MIQWIKKVSFFRGLVTVFSCRMVFGLILTLLSLQIAEAVETNITPTTGSGNLNTLVTQNGNSYDIHGGEQHGTNLFHSFQEFSVGAADTGKFINNTGSSTTNILSRVTGGNISEINGGIDTQAFPHANFYFINPAGIIFGADASLNINGSLHISTADYLSLDESANGARFYADPARQTLLTTAVPSAFGFLQEFPASININGSSLEVKQGQDISLIAGNINIKGGQLVAPEGTLTITSIAKGGNVQFPSNADDPPIVGGDILLTDASNLDTSGDFGGYIVIRGGNLLIDRSTVVSETLGEQDGQGIDVFVSGTLEVNNAASITADTLGTGRGGNVDVRATELYLQGGQINANTLGDGQGGKITVQADNITLVQDAAENRARITAATLFGKGNAGNVFLRAETLSIADDSAVRAISFETASGNAGNVTVEADEIYLNRGGRIIADSKTNGAGGNLTISATELISIQDVYYADDGIDFIAAGLFSDSEGSGDGGAGNIFVTTPQLMLEGGKIGAGVNVPGEGEAGRIVINAEQVSMTADRDGNLSQITVTTKGSGRAGAITLNTETLLLGSSSVIGAFTRGTATGDAGNIRINADQIVISDGGHVSTNSSGAGAGGNIRITANESLLLRGFNLDVDGDIHASGIHSSTRAEGNGGSVYISTPQLEMEGGEISASSSGSGVGGEITALTEQLNMRADAEGNPASITVSSTGTGSAGSINIEAVDLQLRDSHISAASKGVATSTDSASDTNAQTNIIDGGNIALLVSNFISLFDSEITTEVGAGDGVGGNINLDAKVIVLANSQIVADAVQGNGGNIQLVADAFFISTDSQISASSELGFDGEIVIDSPVTDILTSVQLLAADFLDVASILSAPCAQRSLSDVSHLGIRRYEVLPDSPYALRTFRSVIQQPNLQYNSSQLRDKGC